METDLIVPILVFGVFFGLMFYLYYRAQQRIKHLEETEFGVEHTPCDDASNKDDVTVVLVQREQDNCRGCYCPRCTRCAGRSADGSAGAATDASAAYSNSSIFTVQRRNDRFGPPPNYPWPTHDAHLSMDGFPPEGAAAGGVRQQTLVKTAPPAYFEVDLPSYDQAVLAPVHNADFSTTTTTTISATSTTTTTPPANQNGQSCQSPA